MLCEAALTYAELIHRKLQEAGYYDNVGQFDVTDQATTLSSSSSSSFFFRILLP